MRRRLKLTAKERAILEPGMERLRKDFAGFNDLADAAMNMTARRNALNVARSALARLTQALYLLDAIDHDDNPAHQLEQFRALMPAVKAYFDAMTDDDLRRRWMSHSRARFQQNRLRYITAAALDLAAEAGLAVDPPDARTTEVVSWILSYAEREPFDGDRVRKRINLIQSERKLAKKESVKDFRRS
jgi:hypothetical protein